MKIVKIQLDKIEQNENARVVYKTVDLSELMSSMKKDGLLQAVGVRKLPSGNYDAVFGNRRILAAKKLGWKEIEAHLVEAETDNDRDILGLVENFKRQNTSVAEDGRIFLKLKDSGLSVREIASRLDVAELRVTHAIDVFCNFPEEFRVSIVNTTRGTRKVGQIPASIAFAINNMRKSSKLNRDQTRELLNYAREESVGIKEINAVAPLIAAGHTIQRAIGMAGKLTEVRLTLQVSTEYMEKLEKKTKKNYHDLCYEILETSDLLRVSRMGSQSKVPSVRLKKHKELPAEVSA